MKLQLGVLLTALVPLGAMALAQADYRTDTPRRAISLSRSGSRSPLQAAARIICARFFFVTEV